MAEVTRRIAPGVSTIDAAEAASAIPDQATLAVSGFSSVGYPKGVPLALADTDRDLSLSIVSGGSLGAEIDTALVEAGAVDRRYPFQSRQESRSAVNAGEIHFHDRHISSLGDEVAYSQLVDPDIALVEAIAVGPDWLIPSTSIGHTPAYVRSADRLIVEVNEAQPLGLQHLHDIYEVADPPTREAVPLDGVADRIGGPKIHFDPSTLIGTVRTDIADSPYTFKEPGATVREIGGQLASFLRTAIDSDPVLESAVTLQFGVGSIGNALMGQLDRIDFGDRTVTYFGEVIQDGLLDALGGNPLEAASATSLALSAEGQREFFADIDTYVEDVVLRPAAISNGPGLIDRFGVVAINSALEVDIYGHANSTHINGTHVVNGIGGSGDFSRNAHLGIIALPSTAKGGEISRIVPMVTHVDHTEHDFSIIITEQGIADLRGLDPRERAQEVITECAHPDFTDQLETYVEQATAGGGHMPHDLDRVFDFQ